MTKEDTAVDDLDLSAELAGLDIDNDFNFISQSTDSSKELAIDTSILEEEQAESPYVDAVEHWKSVLARDEVFSPMYKPSPREVKELQDLVTYLGLQRKGFLQKEDTKWNELSSQSNIVLKRGPVLCGGQERELILLSHGFVLARVNEAPKFALVRIRSTRTYEQCDLFDAVEHIRSVPTTVTVIVQEDIEEEVAKEDEGEEVFYEEEESKEETSEAPEEEEMAKEEPEEEEEAAKVKPKEEEVAAPQPTKESPGERKKRWFGRRQMGEEEKEVVKQATKGKIQEEAPKAVPKEEKKVEGKVVNPPQETEEPVEKPEDELDKDEEEPEDEQVEDKEGANEDAEEQKDPVEEEKKDTNEGDEKLEVEQFEDTEDANKGDEEPREEEDENEEDVNQDDNDVNQDDNDVVEGDEEERADDEESDEEVAAEDHTETEDHTTPEPHEEEVVAEDEGGNAPENHEEEVAAEDDTKKENVTSSEQQEETKAEVKKKKKLVQRQKERYCFVIKTESNEFFLECDTALLVEAWLEAWERVLVQTRSRQRKHRERGWQHTLVQTSLHAAAITGLDDLCCKEWLGASNELDKYNSLSPLHYAVMVNHMHIMDYLLSHGANPEVKDADGRTPMYYAQRDGLGAAQHLLLEYGAQRSQLCDMEERGELFKGAAQVEAKKAAKAASNVITEKRDESPNEELKSHHEKAVNARGAMADAMNQLKIRGEKISDLSQKTAALEENTKTYGDLAREMKQRAKKKKWYNIV